MLLPGTWPAHRSDSSCRVQFGSKLNSIHLALVFGAVRSCFVPVFAKERQHALFNAHQNHRTKIGIGHLLGSIGLLPHRRTRHPCVDRWSQSRTDTRHTPGNPSRNGALMVIYKMQFVDFV